MNTLSAHLPALQVVVPMLMAPFVVLLRSRSLTWAATTATSAVTFAIAIALTLDIVNVEFVSYAMGSWQAPFGIELRIDSLSVLMLLIVTGASTLALAGSRATLEAVISIEREPYFFAAWLLALAGFTGIIVSADAFNIFVFMEISSLASYVLIAGGPDRRALPATFKYLIMGTIGATFYLIGVGLIYMMTGTLNLADMEIRISDVADQTPILAAAGFITVGLALKAAVFPLHVWLPNAYTYAPHAVTIFFAACATKVSLYVLLRFDFFVFQQNLDGHAFQFAAYLMPLAVLGIIIGSAVALFERDLKRMFAFSSVAQIGYIMLGASLVTAAGLTAATLHMFNHALAKGGVFLALTGLLAYAAGGRLDDIAGIARRAPWTFGALIVTGLSLIGVPGTAGFVSKWYLISAALDFGGLGMILVAVIVIGSLMAVGYVWRLIEAGCFAPSAAGTATQTPASPTLFTVIWVAAIANVVFGIEPTLPLTLSQSAADILLGHVR